jgi:hypothetical protein
MRCLGELELLRHTFELDWLLLYGYTEVAIKGLGGGRPRGGTTQPDHAMAYCRSCSVYWHVCKHVV